MKYSHFLITRFNLPLVWTKDKNNVSTQTEEWLHHRFELFKHYCFPSVANQTSKDFIWMLLFYDGTPEKYKKMNEELEKKHPFYKPCYLNDEQSNHLVEYINNYIADYIEADTEYIITTRMDNDDAIAIEFMEEVEKFAKEQATTMGYVINLIHGIQYYPKYNVSMSVNCKNSHFTSYVEPKGGYIRTIYGCGDHSKVSKNYAIYNIRNKETMWMEVCHERNVANDPHLKWAFNPLFKSFEEERFAVEPRGGGVTA